MQNIEELSNAIIQALESECEAADICYLLRNLNDGVETIDDTISFMNKLSPPEREEDDNDYRKPKKTKWFYVDIKDISLAVKFLMRVEKEDVIGEERDSYNIVINRGPLPNGGNFYEDTCINYTSRELRDKEYTKLKNKLQSFTPIKFL